MKRLLISAMALGAFAGITSCTDLDEELVSNLSSEFYSTPDGLNAAINAAYSQMRYFAGRGENLSLGEGPGTDAWGYGQQNTYQPFDEYSSQLNSTSGDVTNFWNNAYRAINYLNGPLERGPAATGIDPAIKNSRLGEARFMRAYMYFMLVQTYGDVTLNLTETKGIQASATRTPAADVYRAIIADLDTAITLLPVTQSEFGRATRGAAQHLRAKVYLTRAYKSYGSRQADFQKALDDAKAVIASGQYSLTPVYADLWCVARAADPRRSGYCETAGYNEQQREFIFTVQFTTTTSQFDPNTSPSNFNNTFYVTHYDGVAGWAGMARDLNNGRPFRRVHPNPYLIWAFEQTRFPGGVASATADILDTRYDGTFQTYWIANGTGTNAAGTCPACTSGQPIAVGDTSLWMPGYQVSDSLRRTKKFPIIVPCPTGPTVNCGIQNYTTRRVYDFDVFPQMKKIMDNTRASTNEENSGKDGILMRLGETYLIAAEAAVGLNQQSEAATYVNVLRVRAAPANQKSNPAILATAGQMTLDYIMDERARELIGEGFRWYDLVRPGAQYFVDRVKLYNPISAPNVQLRHALRPIPQSQIDATVGGYAQNPGW